MAYGTLKSTIFLLSTLPFSTALSKGLDSAAALFTINDARNHASSLHKRDIDPASLYPEYNLSVPVDHFHNDSLYAPHSNASFNLRYWFDASHYKKGGPIIVLQGGETSGSDRLPFLQKGLLAQLAQATHGIGVVLEHRYYGTSFPTPDLSTENLRFLTTQQALADEAYFARNIKFPGLEHLDLTSKSNAYIGYGGSYAGAFNALLRVVYPEIFWGTISSSGVTEAIYDYWAYYEPIAQYGPPACINAQKTLTHIVDNIVIGKNSSNLTSTLKSAFQLGDLTYTTDFTNVLAQGISNWQGLNWDPAVTSNEVFNYCNNISSTSVLYPETESLRKTATYLIDQGGYPCNTSLVNQFLNYVGYVNLTAVQPCIDSDSTLDECWSNYNTTFYQQDDYSQQGWRSWSYQYCTEWGFLQTGSGVPKDQLPLISRTIDLPYTSTVCRDAFNIYTPSNVSVINQYGGYNISYPRLAIIDGEADPWRLATPHAFGYGAHDRKSTTDEPFILIGGNAVHHWDENGLFANQTTATLPPKSVADTQKQEIAFVKKWMQDWRLYCRIVGGCT